MLRSNVAPDSDAFHCSATVSVPFTPAAFACDTAHARVSPSDAAKPVVGGASSTATRNTSLPVPVRIETGS